MNRIELILAAAGIVTLYALFVLASPHVRCLRCLGRRVHDAFGKGRKRKARCFVCHGTGIMRMPFATMIHRFFWSVLGDQILDRRKQEAAESLAAKKESA